MKDPTDKTLRTLRWLIWTYFWLLLFEGALRKWVVPALSNPLLVVRDPVAIAIYLFAVRARVFPKNGWTWVLGFIAFLCFGITILQLWPYIPPTQIALVDFYGFHANFLHLPLVFVMARVLRFEDVRKFGWWTIVLLLPMTVLLVAQFRAAPDAFLNRTAGGEGEMMTAALGKVRTAGTFSFVLGVVAFYSLATGYLIWGFLNPGVYKKWLMIAAASALLLGVAVSGSRSVVGACAVVAASLVLVIFIRPALLNRFGQTLLIALALGFVVMRLPVFREGVDVLNARFTETAEAEQQSIARDVIGRVFSNFDEPVYVLTKAPFWGYGLGIGTNAGARFLTGHATFLLSESEWSRVFLESGQLLGPAFVIWRICFAIYLIVVSIRALRRGNSMPLLLVTSAFMPLMMGQFGQPTVLGFCVFVAGLALAAAGNDAIANLRPPPVRRRAPPPVRGRSMHAEQLHSNTTSATNGAVDR